MHSSDVPINLYRPVGTAVPIEAVVFDLGGVLLDWDPRHLYRGLFADETDMERFLGELCTPEWHAPHDLGVPAAESCRALASRHPDHADLIWAWSDRSEEMIGGEIAGTVEVLGELVKAGVPCFALTNMEAETYPLRRERYGFLSWFDGTVVSGQEGVAKPDPEIYLRLLDRFGLTASATLMIDNTGENIESAAGLGMQTLLFRSPGQLRRELAAAGLLSSTTTRDVAVSESG
jgi:2-haloacid dehalogenase